MTLEVLEKNIVGKFENVSDQYFFAFPTMFSAISDKKFGMLPTLYLQSATILDLEG